MGPEGRVFSSSTVNTGQTMEVGRRKSMAGEPAAAVLPGGKLHKPPQAPALHKDRAPRNRLKKRAATLPILPSESTPTSLLVLEHDPYPSAVSTQPSEFLGVYSTIDSVTAGAFKHGAYTFSREGLLDGSEYLSPTGRIKISSHTIQRSGVTAAVPERSTTADGEIMRLDIPHPANQTGVVCQELSAKGDKVIVYLAIHEGPRNAFCIGLFTTKNLAWGACLKDKAWLAWSDTLVDEERSIGENNMPQTSARLLGSGRVSWFVKGYEVDSTNVVKRKAEPQGINPTALFNVQSPQTEVQQAGAPPLPPGCRNV